MKQKRKQLMRADRRIIIHVGVHKTGSTSIQGFLHKHRKKLRALSVDFYAGVFYSGNHVELHAAAMRAERATPFRLVSEVVVDETFREGVRARVHQFVQRSRCRSVVFSSEGLSYLRYEDEMKRLRDLFPEGRAEIVMYLRNPLGFLASYKKEMQKCRLPETIDKDSFAYTGENTWLLDFECRLAGFRKEFGAQNVITIDYDDACFSAGNVIPSFLKVLGVESQFSSRDWEGFFYNRTLTARDASEKEAAALSDARSGGLKRAWSKSLSGNRRLFARAYRSILGPAIARKRKPRPG